MAELGAALTSPQYRSNKSIVKKRDGEPGEGKPRHYMSLIVRPDM